MSNEIEIQKLTCELKKLKEQKGEIASQFKRYAEGSDERNQLKLRMQENSSLIKSVEEEIKRFNQTDVSLKEIPQLQPPLVHINKEVLWGKQFSIQLLGDGDLNEWSQFLKHEKIAYCYFDKPLQTIIEKSFGNTSLTIIATAPNGAILGGLPLTLFSSALFGTFAISMPYFNYGGVVTTYFDIAQALILKAKSLCETHSLSHVEIRCMQEGLHPEYSTKKASMILALPKTLGELEVGLGSKIRAQSKKAEQHSPSIQFGSVELLNDFYKVFAQNMRDLGTPVYNKQWFYNLLSSSDISATLAVVYMEGKPVSSGFLLKSGSMLEIPWASTIQSANAKNANMWMYRQILNYAVTQGYDFFDFGRSTVDAGTYKFKKQWGAIPYPHYWYYLVKEGAEKPELNPDNPKFKLFIAIWKRLPVWVTKIVGPQIVKHLP